MNVNGEGRLPPTPPNFEKIWAPSEALKFYTYKGKTLEGWDIPTNSAVTSVRL